MIVVYLNGRMEKLFDILLVKNALIFHISFNTQLYIFEADMKYIKQKKKLFPFFSFHYEKSQRMYS